MKKVFVIPYFGKFPIFFNFFLKSVKYNPEFNWLIFTDDKTPYTFPPNMQIFYTSFEHIKGLFKQKLGENIVLNRPHKLCDYKPTYGYVFEEYLKDADFWGYCDVDLILGKLSDFITNDLLNEYDKLFTVGHMTLFRNKPEINLVFKQPLNGVRLDKIVFSSDKGYAFDEYHCPVGSINHLFDQSKYTFFKEMFFCNIESESAPFVISGKNNDFNSEEKKYLQVFVWEKGNLYRKFVHNNSISTQKYSYVHFHKRHLAVNSDIESDKFMIIPNEIIPFPRNGLSITLIKKYCRKPIINFQFLKVKFKNFRYRIRLFLSK